jgi:predicted protein tyrosine phosphatase
VHPRIATGGAIWTISDVAALKRAGVTHVATMAIELEHQTKRALRGTGIKFLLNGVLDDGEWKDTAFFKVTIDFALDALRDPDAKVVVTCAAGINRGPSGAYAVLRALGYSADDAFDAIVTARPEAQVLYRDDADAAVIELGYADSHERAASRRGARW